MLFDAPRFVQAGFVRCDQVGLFRFGDAGKAVIGRVADKHQNLLVPLDVVRRFPFLGELRPEGNGVFLGVFFPAEEAVGQVYADALVVFQGRARVGEEQAELQMGDDERGGQEFKAVDALLKRLLDDAGAQGVAGEPLEHKTPDFDEVRAGAGGGVEHHHALVQQAFMDAEFGL